MASDTKLLPYCRNTGSSNHAKRWNANDAAMATQSASESPSSISSDGILQRWDVQEILAERTSGGSQKEILVLLKPSWISLKYMISEGPVMCRFRSQPKMSFESETGLVRVKLPVEPGTKLAQHRKSVAFQHRFARLGPPCAHT
jgi:hypothetical protein